MLPFLHQFVRTSMKNHQQPGWQDGWRYTVNSVKLLSTGQRYDTAGPHSLLNNKKTEM